MRDYWKECIKEALEDASIVATDEQIGIVTSWVEGAHENHSLATGQECILNPAETEKDRKIKSLQDEINRLTKVEDMFYKNVATRRGVDVSDVHIDTRNETVTYGKML